jgi:hypothetical protein
VFFVANPFRCGSAALYFICGFPIPAFIRLIRVIRGFLFLGSGEAGLHLLWFIL